MAQPYALKVHYHANGTGRDTYINVSSGGFYKPYKPVPAPPVGSFNTRRVANPAPSPVLHPMAVHYYSDGSGRDSYVVTTEGGLAQNYRNIDYRTAFKQSLRKPDRIRSAFVKRGDHEVGHDR